MNTEQTKTAKGPLTFLPWIFGCVGLVASIAYQAQRSGTFRSFHSISQFIQHHLDAIGMFSSAAALLGGIAGLVILRWRSRSGLVKWGTVFSVLVLLWTVFGLSL